MPPACRSRWLAASTAANSSLQVDTSPADVKLDLRLKIWANVFAHPMGTKLPIQSFVCDNPTLCLTAIGWYALGRQTARLTDLDDDALKTSIRLYLLKRGSCPCSAGPQTQQSANSSRQVGAEGKDSGLRLSSPMQHAYPTTVIDLLSSVRSKRAQPLQAAKAHQGGSNRWASTRHERLIASGRLPVARGPPRAYMLSAEAFGGYGGSPEEVHQASLYIVTEGKKAESVEAVVASAVEVAEINAPIDPQSLYRTSEDAVTEVLELLTETYGKDNVFCQKVVLKLPRLTLGHKSRLTKNSEKDCQDQPKPRSPPDPLLCRCPRALCEAECPTCDIGLHAHEKAALERHIQETLWGLKVEKLALDVVNEVQQKSYQQEVSVASILNLRLALGPSTGNIFATWPFLGRLLTSDWPLFLDPGISLSDVIDFADAANRSTIAAPNEGDEYYAPTRSEETCEKMFSYFANQPIFVLECYERIKECLAVLLGRELSPGYISIFDVYIGFFDEETLQLFDSQGQPERACLSQMPRFRLVNLSSCGFRAHPTLLNTAGKGITAVKNRRKREDRLEAQSMEAQMLCKDLQREALHFYNTWDRTGRASRVLPSSAPMAESAKDLLPIGTSDTLHLDEDW